MQVASSLGLCLVIVVVGHLDRFIDNIATCLSSSQTNDIHDNGKHRTFYVARFFVKAVSELGHKKPVRTTAYIGRVASLMQKNSAVETAEGWLNHGAVVEAFEFRAARMVVRCAQELAKFGNPEEGFAELSADLVEVADLQLLTAN
ncbi:acyl-CoA oxidase 1 [Artemisia annua]|uniref:Acyl-CoA oxidase 1 n=1 Tax=Artemisia annua TaxID=35608 RepID=A0A2U1LL07_ARTAN|nr:acyl-CoA oxidase 1 [Artemisia annua]